MDENTSTSEPTTEQSEAHSGERLIAFGGAIKAINGNEIAGFLVQPPESGVEDLQREHFAETPITRSNCTGSVRSCFITG